jgi:hypothetical protein
MNFLRLALASVVPSRLTLSWEVSHLPCCLSFATSSASTLFGVNFPVLGPAELKQALHGDPRSSLLSSFQRLVSVFGLIFSEPSV